MLLCFFFALPPPPSPLPLSLPLTLRMRESKNHESINEVHDNIFTSAHVLHGDAYVRTHAYVSLSVSVCFASLSQAGRAMHSWSVTSNILFWFRHLPPAIVALLYVCVCAFGRACVYVHACVHAYVCLYVRACVCVNVHVCVCACLSACKLCVPVTTGSVWLLVWLCASMALSDLLFVVWL